MPRSSASPAPTSEIVVYNPGGDLKLDVRTDGETVWLTQEQMCRLFGRTQPVIARHVANIFKEGELEKKVVYAKFAYTTPHGAIPGKTQVKEVGIYNLDVIISVGYRRSLIRRASRRALRSARPASSDCSRLRRSGMVGQDPRRRISMQNMHNNVQNLHIIPSFSAEQSAVVANSATTQPTMPTVQDIWTIRLQGTLSLSSGRAATPRESTDARASRARVSRGMLALAKSRVQQLAPPTPKPKPKIGFAQARR